MSDRKRGFRLGWLLLFIGAGCTVLEPVPDPTRFYLLDAPPPSAGTGQGEWTVGLRRIVLPDYLKSRTIAVRQGRTEVVYADAHRWAEGFDEALLRSVAAHLRASPQVRSVTAAPWKGPVAFDRVVQLRFDACGPAQDGTVRVAASWRVERGDPSALLASGYRDLQGVWTPGDYSEMVNELNRLLAQLVDAVAEDLPPDEESGFPPR